MKKPSPVKETEPQAVNMAEATLNEALTQIRTKSTEHGETIASFCMIAELWSVYISHTHIVRPESWVTASDVAQLMNLLKVARSVYGHSGDNYVDEAGYAALAAYLRGQS